MRATSRPLYWEPQKSDASGCEVVWWPSLSFSGALTGALKWLQGAADSEDDSRLGTDGNHNRPRSFEKGRRTTPPFSCARPESARADPGRAKADPFMGARKPDASRCEVGR